MRNQDTAGYVAAGALGEGKRGLSARRGQRRNGRLAILVGAAIAAALVVFGLSGAMAQVDPVPAGALAHWAFDGNGSDVSGNGRNLDLTGSPGFTDAECGKAIVLDGTKWAERPVDDQPFDFGGGDFTISAWFSVDDATLAERMLVSKWAPEGSQFAGWYLRYQGNGQFLLSDGYLFNFPTSKARVVSGA
ncbi:MAG: hypothetical protein M3203_04160 [Actinomycetota bacterium]|nr:hypothetical protein [Actinomycetota bacterium]